MPPGWGSWGSVGVRTAGPRSFEALKWLERLEVAGLEPLALAHGLGQRAAYSHVERLVAQGLVERTYDRDGSLVAITLAGRRAARPDVHDGRPARVGLAGMTGRGHYRAVSWVAARTTLRELEWVSEREMRTRPEWQIPVIWSRRGNHRPDLGALVNGKRVAAEVELTAKSPRRLRAILAGYESQVFAGRLAGVVYVSDHPAVLRGIERAAAATGPTRAHLRIMSLTDVQAQVRELGQAARQTRLSNRVGRRT